MVNIYYNIKKLIKFTENIYEIENHLLLEICNKYYLFNLEKNKISWLYPKINKLIWFKEYISIIELKFRNTGPIYFNKFTLKEIKFGLNKGELITNFQENYKYIILKINYDYLNIYDLNYNIKYEKIMFFKEILDYILILENNVYLLYYKSKLIIKHKLYLDLEINNKFIFIKINNDYYKVLQRKYNEIIDFKYNKITYIKELKNYLILKINYHILKIIDINSLKEKKFPIENITDLIQYDDLLIFEINKLKYEIYRLNKSKLRKININLQINEKIIIVKESLDYIIFQINNKSLKIFNKLNFEELKLSLDYMERITEFIEQKNLLIIRINHNFLKFFPKNSIEPLIFESKISNYDITPNNYLVLQTQSNNYIILFLKTLNIIYKNIIFTDFQIFNKNFILTSKYFFIIFLKDQNIKLKNKGKILNITNYYLKQIINSQIYYLVLIPSKLKLLLI